VQTNAGCIALIAYTMGGWLLPSLHDHGSHQHSASAERSSLGLLIVPNVASTCGSYSHSHHRTPHNVRRTLGQNQDHETTQIQNKASAGPPGFESGPAATFHDHGLCALCIARSMNGPRATLKLGTFRPVDFCSTTAPKALHCLQSWLMVKAPRGSPNAA
jgi:hypothetical protein